MILTPAVALTMSAGTRQVGVYAPTGACAAGAVNFLASLRSL
jgi:hypothetical protein